ncbi:MAG: ATP-binding cassette domain-containing protein [Anaerovoracaceae bacterium]
MIEIKNLSKQYGKTLILNEFSHQISSRGITCLLGASGVGKSTLFNLLAGFDRDYTGEIFVEGQNLATLSLEEISDYRNHCIGFVFQEYNLLSGYSVLENILLAAILNNDNKEENKLRALSLLKRLGIEEKADEKIENLSGGQKQRVAIARALIGNPKVILADEPTGALDRNTANETMRLLSELAEEIPVFIITHDPKICDFADEVIAIEDGKCKVLKENLGKHLDAVSNQTTLDSPSVHMPKLALQNFKVNIKCFLGIALAITIAVCSVLMSFSSQNIIDDKIRSFEEKNTAFAWGQVSLDKEANKKSLFHILNKSEQIKSYYNQYSVDASTISFGKNSIHLPPKTFGAISAETMNIGNMPINEEVAITPSLAKQFAKDIRTLIGKKVVFKCGNFNKELTISGIFNGSFDDYYLSPAIEKKLYKSIEAKGNPISISYKVKEFHDVLDIEKKISKKGFTVITASKQTESLEDAFTKLQTIFIIISVFILAISLFICIMLLIRIARMRTREVGLLMALGYKSKQIKKLLFWESMLTSTLSASTTTLILLIIMAISGNLPIKIIITPIQFVLSVISTLLLVWFTTGFYNSKLLKVDPAVALRQ